MSTHDSQPKAESRRFAFEAQLPPKKPGGRPRYVAFGRMRTSPLNDLPDKGSAPAVVYDCGILGDFKPPVRRRRRPDGTRAPAPPPVLGAGQRLAVAPTLDVECAVRADVQRALADGEPLACRPLVRVVATLTCAVRTIPYKGQIVRWASADDLVQAIATGAY